MTNLEKEANTLEPIRDRTLHLDGVKISNSYIPQRYFSEHSTSQIKIAVPIGNSSITVCYETAIGNRKTLSINEEHVSIIPPDLEREIFWEKESELLAIYLDRKIVIDAANEYHGSNLEIIENWTVEDALIRQLGLTLRSELQGGNYDKLYLESLINFLSVHLIKNYSTQQKPLKQLKSGLTKHKLKQIVDYINNNLHQDLSLKELARLVQISPYHFTRQFKQSTALPPHQYIIRTRIERAKQLLKQGNLTIAQVAYIVGFSHQSHLNRHFKRLVGVTPKVFVKQNN
ncbi:AraC family transcriptional regulator [Calothrix parasitica NIES-267]|uniref:AraC family transcriptional regulator n=1 Tax=Calothrix parasitica NIES-267 TaxID=1973488 RepID=A0A1Z4M238_9CYAN|nr:AraC family transcriptional regulator [Calothrix parasitica NIES-267]